MFIASPAATRLDDVATRTYHAAPDDVARLGFAIAHLLDESAPEVPDLPADLRALAAEIAQALKKAQRPLVISGPSCNNEAVIQSAANVARALCAGWTAGWAEFHRTGVQQLRTGAAGWHSSQPSVYSCARRSS